MNAIVAAFEHMFVWAIQKLHNVPAPAWEFVKAKVKEVAVAELSGGDKKQVVLDAVKAEAIALEPKVINWLIETAVNLL